MIVNVYESIIPKMNEKLKKIILWAIHETDLLSYLDLGPKNNCSSCR